MNYQTDFEGSIRKDGCLVFTIFRECEKLAGKPLKRQHALNLIDELHYVYRASYNENTPVLSAENDWNMFGVFVWDHAQVFNQALKFLRSNKRVRYKGRIYMPWEVERGKKSFGTHGGDVLIIQVRTENGNGHFRSLNYDPWQPSPKVEDVKSLRFYQVYEV